MIPRHVIVFAREPRFGSVKTRLAGDIGEGAAYAFYRRNLARTLGCLGADPRWTTWLALTPPQAARRLGACQREVRVFAQTGGDLGQRMAAAFRHLPAGPAILVGSDIPDLGPRHVARAFRSLADHGAVFGPTGDGGFYLVGFCDNRRADDAFAGVRWSTRHALADTLANLGAAVSVAMVDELIDIDTGADLERWRARAAPR